MTGPLLCTLPSTEPCICILCVHTYLKTPCRPAKYREELRFAGMYCRKGETRPLIVTREHMAVPWWVHTCAFTTLRSGGLVHEAQGDEFVAWLPRDNR